MESQKISRKLEKTEERFMDEFERRLIQSEPFGGPASQRQLVGHLMSANSYPDYLELFDHQDTDVKSFATEMAGRLGHLLSIEGRREVIAKLETLKKHPSSRVSNAVRAALVSLECAGEAAQSSLTREESMTAWMGDLRASLNIMRDTVGDGAFAHRAERLSAPAQWVFFWVLGGNSSEEMIETIALREFHSGQTAQPTHAEMAAAEAKSRFLLHEIETRFELGQAA